MADKFNLKALISATDKLTPVLQSQMKVLNTWKRQFNNAGKGGVAMGLGLGAALAVPAKAFADLESGATQLQNTLMDKSGVAAGFDQLSKLAIELGNQLPGTTADFYAMASQLKSLGVSTDTITNGALKATAYLAVVGKNVGVTYESAADAVGKVGKAFGIAANDLVPFADTLQRALHMGVDLTEMQYAMAKVAPRLKSMGVQGLNVANDLVPLVSMLTSIGMSGDTAGTGIEKMIAGANAAGKFKGVQQLVADLEKFAKMGSADRMDKFKKLFGDEGERAASVIAAGGYAKMVKSMQDQASLQQRINNSLGTMTNLWEAATGTFTNALAAFGEVYAPELKQLATLLNDVGGKAMDWAKANGPLIKSAIALAGGVVTMKIGMLGLAAATGVASAAMRVFTGVTKLNPFMLLLQGALIAAPLIYENWGAVTKFVSEVWDGAVQKLSQGWQSFVDFLSPGIETVKFLFESVGKVVLRFVDLYLEGFKKLVNNPVTKLIGQGVMFLGGSVAAALPSLPDMSNSGSAQAGNMRPPGFQKNIVAAGKVSGGIDVNFNNAPAGMRVAPVQTRGNVAVNPNVGYRTAGSAMGAW